MCTITDVIAEQVVTHWSLRELKSDLHGSLSQVCMCGYEECNTRDPMRSMYRMDLRCTDDTWPRPPVGMETEGGGCRRLPRNVRNDEMGYEIWVCEDLLIVFLIETRVRRNSCRNLSVALELIVSVQIDLSREMRRLLEFHAILSQSQPL